MSLRKPLLRKRSLRNRSGVDKDALTAARQLAEQARNLAKKAGRAKRKAKGLHEGPDPDAVPDTDAPRPSKSRGPADEQPPNDDQKIRLNQQINQSTVGALVH